MSFGTAAHDWTRALVVSSDRFAVHLRDGDVYSVDEVRGWPPEIGWRFVEHVALAGPSEPHHCGRH
jgi:hypothetical protein